MGRKMKATKSGKFINPTDQARKEARKRELRKNKKQRLIVRTAVLKGKDPFQIIADLERLDKMEFDFSNHTSLNEKVLKDKRRKLMETWDRICRLYTKEDKDKYLEMKRIEIEYEAKRNELVKQFEAVKSAQEVSVEDMPLPSLPMEPASSAPSETCTNSILKSTSKNKVPPGCPQGLPPALTEFEVADEDSHDEDEEEAKETNSSKKIRFADETPTKDRAENLKEFLKEIEQLSGDREGAKDNSATDENARQVLPAGLRPPASAANAFYTNQNVQPAPPVLVPASLPAPHVPLPLRPTVPFVAPPRLPVPSRVPMPPQAPPRNPTPIAPPTHSYGYPRKPEEKKPQVATISAKPQLRNLSADATKFMPLALRVKRDDKLLAAKKTPKSLAGYGMVQSSGRSATSAASSRDQTNSKDDAYVSFMKEMHDLI